ncbi:hypothetical protein HOLleu_41143 [Holothuria leucospilota]|uniref:SCAN box domain-containing protein n=1 Tax=Holothuria leucospilota TaxID=206669 RepID=A0A9Q0YBH4_HOLLE|nr:hypothetical protein HOLleu_41143 [Holothuria leucospilota]
MTINCVPEDRWVHWLVPQLCGKAQEAYNRLALEDLQDYQKVKSAILEKYQLDADAYRMKFRSSKRREGQTYKEWITHIGDMFDKWMKTSGVNNVCSEMRDVLILEHAFNMLPQDLSIKLRESNPPTAKILADRADDYEVASLAIKGKFHGSQSRSLDLVHADEI